MQYKIFVDSRIEATVRSASLAADLVDHFYKAGPKGRYPKVELVKGTETLVRYIAIEPKEGSHADTSTIRTRQPIQTTI